ncbi:uncharacterized protein LOC116800287 [Drosophila sechellia]|uniref:Uncharacterized protein n=2 Tax=melanogaster subgroup TaxID=32351 RepID=A0A0J9RA40_DROSI|nr:uncharacterized protein LOC27206744 [Drosophila simulans]XP_032570059.1 uncharacterized protein LOC116800287 [Drosophila sechellia]XP_033156510.1 uncharacterized protein LOC117138490 [Drosophila mauritiana]XP_044778689.1 uncharacterized protein LOC27206744 [Drosophila simulans]KMY92901.1 uncharacterized protein Dsimw501_GD26893 [Drosophila simulans]
MVWDTQECSNQDDDFERPSRTLILVIFTLAVFLKLFIILLEIMS